MRQCFKGLILITKINAVKEINAHT